MPEKDCVDVPERERVQAEMMLQSPVLSLAGASFSPGDVNRSVTAIFGAEISSNEQMGSGEDEIVDALRNEHSTLVMQHSTALLRTKQV